MKKIHPFRKKILCAALLCGVLCGCQATTALPSASPVPSPAPASTAAPTPSPVHTVHFTASGDNLIHGSIYLQARTKDGYDFAPLYENVKEFYAQYDLNFLNQETLVNREIPPRHYPCFSTPAQLGQAAYDVGFRLFGGANNHSYDLGAKGIDATLRFWSSMPQDALYFGWYRTDSDAALQEVPLYEKNGIRFACLAFTEQTNGFSVPSGAQERVVRTSETEVMRQQIESAKKLADIVLVSVHWGIENSHTVTPEQQNLAQQFADWGADLIIGTHPHVIQPLVVLTAQDGRQVPCAYSLGNFVSAQNLPDELLGYVFTCSITKTGDSACTVSDLQAVPIITYYGAQYSNIRVWPLSALPEDMLKKHGVRVEYPYFDRAYIQSVYEKNLDACYLPENWLGGA